MTCPYRSKLTAFLSGAGSALRLFPQAPDSLPRSLRALSHDLNDLLQSCEPKQPRAAGETRRERSDPQRVAGGLRSLPYEPEPGWRMRP